ncbi:glycosyltransferase family 2 protein [Sphingomonas sp.]|uniref:glycosyltransferase n=1 Tax=Sphingomonas sp. TaxID=28214 RepID=UPI000DB4481E|nr:glycosyltransferase family A protein [Sphingomonas sp.]PZU07485.1 MAG: glycosyl transferase [Sphingomonas sp.]
MPELMGDRIGIVVIGRNEGERLKACLRSVIDAGPVVYVDSGSTDGSQDFARSLGVEVIGLAVPPNFTAARARNTGLDRLTALHPDITLAQMVDGDCEVRPGWIDAARAALEADPGLALVFGRRRERFPDRSIYNALCDDEWNIPVGEAAGCGGDALIRLAALRDVDGYDASMIAGEDSEMSMRMRKKGWRLARIDAEMTWHDAALLRFGQWWRRSRRAGHGFAEMAWRHPDARWPNWPRTCRSILIWGAAIPALAIAAALLAIVTTPLLLIVTLALIALYPFKMARIAAGKRAQGLSPAAARGIGTLLMLGKFPELLGLIGYHRDRLRGRASRIIEYKGAA